MDNKSPGSRPLARANPLEAKPASHHIRPMPQAHTLFIPMYFDPVPPFASPSHSAAARVRAGGSQGLGFRSHSTKLQRRNFPSLNMVRRPPWHQPKTARRRCPSWTKGMDPIYNITADQKNLMQECTNVSGEQRDFYHGYATGELNKEASYSRTIASKVHKYLNDMDARAVNEPMKWNRSKAVNEQMRSNHPQLLN